MYLESELVRGEVGWRSPAATHAYPSSIAGPPKSPLVVWDGEEGDEAEEGKVEGENENAKHDRLPPHVTMLVMVGVTSPSAAAATAAVQPPRRE